MKTNNLYLRQFHFDSLDDMFNNRRNFIDVNECFSMSFPDDKRFCCVDVLHTCKDNHFVRVETFVEDTNVEEYYEIVEKSKKARDASSQLPAPADDC